MQIDITKLLTNQVSTINFENIINISKQTYLNSLIDNLKDINFKGKLTINENNELILTGTLKGIMTLKDDLTLSPVDYNFTTEVEETLDKNQKLLDITDVLWQNILVEIPSKVRSTDEDIELKGDGWRVISEEKFNEERSKSNNPFSNLNELLNMKEEK